MIAALLVGSWCGAFEAPLPAAAVEGRAGPSPAVWSAGDPLQANPALAAFAPAEVGAGHARPLGLDGLSEEVVWAHGGFLGFGGGLRWRSLRAEEIYREDGVEGDFAWGLGKLALGGGPRWGRFGTEGAVRSEVWAGAGLCWRAASGVAWGMSWQGRGAPWRAGVGWVDPDSLWRADLGVEGPLQEAWSIRLGQELRLDPLRIRLGVRGWPWVAAVGLGVARGGLRLDWSASGDRLLGWEQNLSIAAGF